jgi:hypothetical protein
MPSKITFNTVRSYFHAARLLHAITLADLLLCILLLSGIHDTYKDGTAVERSLYPVWLFFLFSLLILSQLDARSRFQNYKQIKDQLFLYGFNPRIIRPVLKSRCQRDAALRAATELGLGNRCRDYFRDNGYRWYYILPDYVFQKPQFLVTKYFWMTTFFTPTYYPRVDYSTGLFISHAGYRVLI